MSSAVVINFCSYVYIGIIWMWYMVYYGYDESDRERKLNIVGIYKWRMKFVFQGQIFTNIAVIFCLNPLNKLVCISIITVVYSKQVQITVTNSQLFPSYK